MRRFLNKRTLLIAFALLLLVSLAAVFGAYQYVNSPEFDKLIRDLAIQKTKEYTGAEVSIGNIRWSLREQHLLLEDITLRGTEPASDPPLAHIESIATGIRFRSLLQHRVDLFELRITNPEFHVRVDEDGRTNLPGLRNPIDELDARFSVSIDEFQLVGGKAIVNDRPTNIEFAITNLVSDFRYRADTQVLSTKLSYTGTLTRDAQKAIPYTLSSEFDFTRGTISSLTAKVLSGKSSIDLQGRIDKALTEEVTAQGVEYSAKIDSAFAKYFSDDVPFASATTRGKFDFSSGKFSTTGELTAPKIEFEGWTAGPVKSTYVYHYPDKQVKLGNLTATVFNGTAEGSAVVSMVSAQPHITFDVDYAHVDSAQLVRAFPWDPKYRIYSSLDGHLQGWFEVRPTRYELNGNAVLLSYPPPSQAGIVPFPVSGNLSFALRPGQTEINSADLRFRETSIRATGKIMGTEPDLSVDVASSNLSDLVFIYPDINGKGSFRGTVKGPLEKPILDGVLSLDTYKYREWTIRHAEGSVKLDMQTELADLRGVTGTVGESTATIEGTASLNGSSVDLSIHSDHVRVEDFSSITKEITKEKVTGILKGAVQLTSLNPLKVSGRVSADNLTVRGHTLDTFSGDVTYNDPQVEIRNITASELGADLKSGNLQFNRTTGVMKATADVSSIAFNRLREVGIPDTLNGNVQKAHITVTGTQDHPHIEGNATIENLSFHDETFPMVTLVLSTATNGKLHVVVGGTPDLDISADIDLSGAGYPLTAKVNFQNYSIERLANFSQGTLTATGEATISGQLSGQGPFTGKGKIQSLQATIREYQFHEAKPFAFEFDSNRLKLTEGATFSGAYSTLVELKGTIGLTDTPVLDLDVAGNLDLSEVTAAYDLWSVTGLVKVNGQIRGKPSSPSISGVANLTNGSLGREGIYTTLSGLSGDVRFNENRITLEKLEGRVGLGTVTLQGTGLIQNSQVEGLNVRIDTNQVRLRYPAGLRSSVTGSLLVRGTSTDPSLEGSVRLDSLTYRSDFEPFLALFRPGGLDSGGTALDRLRLNVHIAGNRNISVQNELTDITSGRVDLDVKGTWASPTLTGHVEATDGTLSFQGKRYEVTRGNIDFADPFKIEPVVDIQAETDLRDYRVILSITGKGDKIRAEFRSDPPLPQLELVSLIAGGKTREELERSQAGTTSNASLPTSEQLFQGGAASILTEQLRQKVGSRLGLMGLDFIRIDPHFETAGSNPSLRVTVSQQVNKDLSVTYSQDLASTQQRLVMIEYFISKNTSIVASREENNDAAALGLDIKLRKRF